MVPPAPAPKDRHHGPAKDRDRSEPGQPRARHACRPTGGEQATTPAGGTLPHRRSHAMRRDGTWPPAQRVVPQAITQGWYLKPSAQRMVLGHQHRGWYLKPSRRDGTSSHQHSGWYLATSTEGGTSSHHVGMVPLAICTADGTSSHQHSGWYLKPCHRDGTRHQHSGWYLGLKAGYPLRGWAVVAVASTPVYRGWLSTE